MRAQQEMLTLQTPKGSAALCGCFDLEKEGKGPKMANVNKNRRRLKFQDRALFGYLEQNRRMEAFII